MIMAKITARKSYAFSEFKSKTLISQMKTRKCVLVIPVLVSGTEKKKDAINSLSPKRS